MEGVIIFKERHMPIINQEKELHPRDTETLKQEKELHLRDTDS
jgi:hypothetical protein